MRRALVLPLVLVTLVLPPSSAPQAKKPPRLGARIDALMAAWSKPDGPGCAVAVVQKGAIVHQKGYGMADLEHGVPIRPDSVFDIGSTSKQFTAAAVLLLAAEGKLSLDDDVRKHLPELPSLGSTITLRHLLHHTSGLRDYTGLLALGGAAIADVTTAADALAALARQQRLEFVPGARFEYSNSGYFLLAQVVERVTRKRFAEVAAERFFAPLGMKRSHVHDDHTLVVPGRAVGYAPRAGGGWAIEMSQWEQTGDGAVMTTVLDLARWDANFYDAKVGGQALVDGLQVRGKTSTGEPLGYAAGLFMGSYRGLEQVSHGGAWAGYRAELLRFPGERTSVIVLCNAASSNPTALAHAIADVVLEKRLAAVPAPAAAAVTPEAPALRLTDAELDAWAGTYREVPGGGPLTITRVDGALGFDGGGERYTLAPTGKHAFVMVGLPVVVTFTFAGAAPARRLTVVADGQVERYEELKPYAPAAAELRGVAGRYRSAELAVDWTITLEAGKLRMRGAKVDGPLEPTVKDQFSWSEGAVLTIRRDKKGVVTGFTASAARFTGLDFERVK